jgi:hypothetical protein
MFKELVAIELVSLIPSAEKALHSFVKKVVLLSYIAPLWPPCESIIPSSRNQVQNPGILLLHFLFYLRILFR